MFKELHDFAKASPLILTFVAEGDQLRVTLIPQLDASMTVKAAPHPLTIVATPEELDADFAAALGIYTPSALSVLEQAGIAAKVNDGKDAGKLPAPSATEKASKPAAPAGPGRGRRAAKPADTPTLPSSADQANPDDEGKDDKTIPLPLSDDEPRDAAPPAPGPAPAPAPAPQPEPAPAPAPAPAAAGALDIAI